MNNEKLTIFLSHSHKDVEKVRKIRDILEIIGCEPLMFFLKCLDDDNEKLEDFIKKEIDARNIFLYCKSENAERSVWVQKELEYIKSLDKSRLYEVDIENDFSAGTVSLLNVIMDMLRKNNVLVSYSSKTRRAAESIITYLSYAGMKVFSIQESYSGFDSFVNREIDRAAKEGVIIVVAEEGEDMKYAYKPEIEKAQKEGAKVLRVNVKNDDLNIGIPSDVFGMGVPEDYERFFKSRTRKEGKDNAYIDDIPTKNQLDKIYGKLLKI